MSDAHDELFGSGVASVTVELDGQPQQTTAIGCRGEELCEQARSFTWDTTAAPNGDHTMTVTATDNAGNVATDTVDVELARQAEQPPKTTSQRQMTINGADVGDQAGVATTALGDINGDGLQDYAVGAPNARSGLRLNAGTTYIVLGRSEASTIDLANPGPGVSKITGPAASSFCGTSIAAVGDVNGDGIGDMLVGCPGMDSRAVGLSQQGRAYVIFGSASPQDVDLASPGDHGFAIAGPTNAYVLGVPYLLSRPTVFGESLRGTPQGESAVSQDVNGDDLADIIIGDSAVNSAAGATYVIYGKTTSTAVDTNALGSSGFVIRGTGNDALSGYSAAIVGDVTADGLADIVIGAPGRGSIASPAAYLVAGRDSTSPVELSDPGPGVVKLTSAPAQDRFGVDVSALGDTDLDGRGDFAVATSSGAFVVRTPPTADGPLTTSNGYAVTGPANQPLLDSRLPAAHVAPAGDADQDGRADLAISYPDTSGTSRGYVVLSPEANRTMPVSTLPGQRGVALAAGSQTDRSGASVAGSGPLHDDDGIQTQPAQAIVGAPDALPSNRLGAGQAMVLTDLVSLGGADARAAAVPKALVGCGYKGKNAYPFTVNDSDTGSDDDDAATDFRYGYHVPLEPKKDAGGNIIRNPDGSPVLVADYGAATAVLPRCRRTSRDRPDRVSGVKAQKSYTNLPLNVNGTRDSMGRTTWPIVDSFGDMYAQLRQTTKAVKVQTPTGVKDKRKVTNWEVLNPGGTVLSAGAPSQVNMSVQGYACYVGNGDRDDYAMVALQAQPFKDIGGKGVRGFIARGALKSTYVEDALLVKGDTTCGESLGLTKALKPPTGLPSEGNFAGEYYQGRTTARNICLADYTAPDCGTPYDSYEPPEFPGVKQITRSTTGITGGTGRSAGVTMAIVREGDTFKQLDRIGYNDPNVPCGRQPSVRWVYGNANPGNGKAPIFGWVPEHAATAQPDRTCPAPK